MADSSEIKHESPIDSLGFAMLWHVISHDHRISDGAMRTYCFYLRHATQGRATVLHADLAIERGVDIWTLSQHKKELIANGYLETKQQYKKSDLIIIKDIRKNDLIVKLAQTLLSGHGENPMTTASGHGENPMTTAKKSSRHGENPMLLNINNNNKDEENKNEENKNLNLIFQTLVFYGVYTTPAKTIAGHMAAAGHTPESAVELLAQHLEAEGGNFKSAINRLKMGILEPRPPLPSSTPTATEIDQPTPAPISRNDELLTRLKSNHPQMSPVLQHVKLDYSGNGLVRFITSENWQPWLERVRRNLETALRQEVDGFETLKIEVSE